MLFTKPHIKKREQNFINDLRDHYHKWRKSDEKKDDNLGVFDVLNESIDLTQETLSKLMLQQFKPDLTIEISRKVCGTMDFHKTPEILASGREAYHKAMANNPLF